MTSALASTDEPPFGSKVRMTELNAVSLSAAQVANDTQWCENVVDPERPQIL